MKKCIFSLLMILSVSCNSEKDSRSEPTNKDKNAVETKTTEIKGDTSFFGFFEKFMQDNEFQKSRVLFPIQQYGSEIKTSQEWEYLPFYAQSERIPTLNSDTVSVFDSKNEKAEEIEVFVVDFEKKNADKFAFKKVNNNWHLKKSEKAILADLPDKEFIDFLMKFSRNLNTQTQHIQFPLTESFIDTEKNYEIVKKKIKAKDWKFNKLTDSINELMLLSSLEKNNKYRNITLRGVQNGIWVKYTFEKINNIWKLVLIEDHST